MMKKLLVAGCVLFALAFGLYAEAENTPDGAFTLASFNIRCRVKSDEPDHGWAKRAPRCRTILREDRIDLCGLQEAALDQIRDLIRDTGYAYVGGGRDDFRKRGEFTCILYRKSRFAVLKSGTFGLSETPDKPGVRSWGSRCPRIATWGLFRDRKTGKEFFYYNTHLDHVSKLARENGVRLIVEHAKKHAAGKPVVLTGDFNTRPDTPPYRCAAELLADAKKVSQTPHAGPAHTYHNWGAKKIEIDYVFVSPAFWVLSHRTEDRMFDGFYASDHFPVIVELEL